MPLAKHNLSSFDNMYNQHKAEFGNEMTSNQNSVTERPKAVDLLLTKKMMIWEQTCPT